jgi:hypothetical protein
LVKVVTRADQANMQLLIDEVPMWASSNLQVSLIDPSSADLTRCIIAEQGAANLAELVQTAQASQGVVRKFLKIAVHIPYVCPASDQFTTNAPQADAKTDTMHLARLATPARKVGKTARGRGVAKAQAEASGACVDEAPAHKAGMSVAVAVCVGEGSKVRHHRCPSSQDQQDHQGSTAAHTKVT